MVAIVHIQYVHERHIFLASAIRLMSWGSADHLLKSKARICKSKRILALVIPVYQSSIQAQAPAIGNPGGETVYILLDNISMYKIVVRLSD